MDYQGIPLPQWMYDRMQADGRDMSNYVRVTQIDPPKKPKVVRYLNREARRAAKRGKR